MKLQNPSCIQLIETTYHENFIKKINPFALVLLILIKTVLSFDKCGRGFEKTTLVVSKILEVFQALLKHLWYVFCKVTSPKKGCTIRESAKLRA